MAEAMPPDHASTRITAAHLFGLCAEHVGHCCVLGSCVGSAERTWVAAVVDGFGAQFVVAGFVAVELG
jgi:hypothetical protein